MLTPVVLAHLLPPVVTIILSTAIGAWIWQKHRNVRGVELYLLVTLVGGIIWQLQLVALILTTDWQLARFLVTSEKITGFLASFIWVFFIGEYTNNARLQSRWVYGLFGLTMAGLALFAITNPAHRLFMIDIVRVEEPFFHGSAVRGPVYFILLAIVYGYVVTGMVVIARFLTWTRRSAWARIALLAIGAIGVGIGNLSSVAGLGPISTFQYGGYGAFPFILATTLGVFRMGMFDLAPVARTTLVETLNDAVLVLDEEERVVDYNRQTVSIWPTLPEDEGKPFSEACPELAGEVVLGVEEARTRQITLSVDGETRFYSLLVSPIERARDETTIIGHSILLRDVTDLEQSRQQLASQNRRLDQVAGTVSHDLRNPLNVAKGYTALLEEEIDDPALRDYLESIQHSHDRMHDIIDDVLTFARQGEEITEVESVAIETIAREAWDNVDTGTAVLDLTDTSTIMADRSRLLTIFENLFRNAVEHGGDDATVTVGTFDSGFFVADDGPGIAPDERSAAFKTGYSTAEDGTGFGLAIVKEIVDAHEWEISVTDGDQGGARFEITDVTDAVLVDPHADDS